MNDAKFSRGQRIYPNLAALDASTPGHTWGTFRKGQGWSSKDERVAHPLTVVRVLKGGTNGLGEAKYELRTQESDRRSQYDQAWVDRNFVSEPEHVEYLLTVAMSPFETLQRTAARNALMDIAERLTVEVSAVRGDSYTSAFEALLSSWGKYQYRPTLSVRDPKTKALADIYDCTQALRGVNVAAFRSHG